MGVCLRASPRKGRTQQVAEVESLKAAKKVLFVAKNMMGEKGSTDSDGKGTKSVREEQVEGIQISKKNAMVNREVDEGEKSITNHVGRGREDTIVGVIAEGVQERGSTNKSSTEKDSGRRGANGEEVQEEVQSVEERGSAVSSMAFNIGQLGSKRGKIRKMKRIGEGGSIGGGGGVKQAAGGLTGGENEKDGGRTCIEKVGGGDTTGNYYHGAGEKRKGCMDGNDVVMSERCDVDRNVKLVFLGSEYNAGSQVAEIGSGQSREGQ